MRHVERRAVAQLGERKKRLWTLVLIGSVVKLAEAKESKLLEMKEH